MKKTLVARLVVGALAAIAAGGVMAGQIQSSSTSLAREVVTTNTQAVDLPTVSYRFFGDVVATSLTQVFQVQLTLDSPDAEWDTASAPTDDAFGLTDKDANPIVGYSIVGKGFSADKKTLWATYSVPAGTGAVTQPIVGFNVAGATTPAKVVNLKKVVGDLVSDYTTSGKCSDTKELQVSFKHFNALSQPAQIADGVVGGNGTADEHARLMSTNTVKPFVFPTNLLPIMSSGNSGAQLSAGGNMSFTFTGGLPVIGGGVSNALWTATADPLVSIPGTATALVANLGTVEVKQNASGIDSNMVAPAIYRLFATGPAIPMVQTATSAVQTGAVEASKVVVDVTSTNGWVKGGRLELRAYPADAAPAAQPAIACSGVVVAGSAVNITDANKNSATLSIVLDTQAKINAAFGGAGLGKAHICYVAPGAEVIPSAQFSGVTRIYKAPEGVANTAEQDNICGHSLASLGGGLKIDVRNYASSKEEAASRYVSVIRLINNSDTRPADVWGQLIHQSGKFGGYGKLTTLAPREVKNMNSKEIDALLIKAPEADAAADNGGVAPVASGNVGAPRLRITSPNGASLRVQNYLYNVDTAQIYEASGSQAVDFEGTTTRAPSSDGQYISQDANSGLNGK